VIIGYFSKIYQENSSLIKTSEEQRVLFMDTDIIFDHVSLISS